MKDPTWIWSAYEPLVAVAQSHEIFTADSVALSHGLPTWDLGFIETVMIKEHLAYFEPKYDETK